MSTRLLPLGTIEFRAVLEANGEVTVTTHTEFAEGVPHALLTHLETRSLYQQRAEIAPLAARWFSTVVGMLTAKGQTLGQG